MTDTIEKYVLAAAREAYSAQCDLRRRRMRYKRFTYGDQWGDMVRDSRGAWYAKAISWLPAVANR